MNTLKVLCLTFVLVLVSFSAEAHTSFAPDSKPEYAQLKKYLQKIDFTSFVKGATKINVNFLINSKNEVIVISTSDKDMDFTVKNALNYKQIEVSDLEYNKIYTLPVLFQ